MTQFLLDYMVSLKKGTTHPAGTPDPYVPSGKKDSAPETIEVPVD